jgi:type IV secretory pathway VirD2 relaxase
MVSSKAEPTLREPGERGDIIKAMHRALERQRLVEDRHPSRYVLHREKIAERITSRVLRQRAWRQRDGRAGPAGDRRTGACIMSRCAERLRTR